MNDETDIDSQIEDRKLRRNSGGASISVRDGRVSKALGWFWGIVGTGIAGSVLLAANNLYQLNLTVARGLDNDAVVAAQLKDHEDRLRAVERDVNTLEGKVFRGVDGYDRPQTVPRGH